MEQASTVRVCYSRMGSEEDVGLVFGEIFPIALRIQLAANLGLLSWYLVVVYCVSHASINILRLLSLSYNKHNYTQLDKATPSSGEFPTSIPPEFSENKILILGARHKLKQVSLFTILVWVLNLILQLIIKNVNGGDNIKRVSEFILFACLIHAMRMIFYKSTFSSESIGEHRMVTTLKRVLKGGINSFSMRTNDILISDSLMSYNKIINDFFHATWKLAVMLDYNPKLEFAVLCLPVLLRMKQCLSEYRSTRQRQHLLNFIKYTTNIFPLFIGMLIHENSFLEGKTEDEDEKSSIEKNLKGLKSYWFLFALINSSYSFVWDIKMDWGFSMFEFAFSNSPKVLLRPDDQLIYQGYLNYIVIIVVNLSLRFIWILKYFCSQEGKSCSKVSNFIFGGNSLSCGYFCLELLEILRRSLWVLLKLENDYVKLRSKANEIELDQLTKRSS